MNALSIRLLAEEAATKSLGLQSVVKLLDNPTVDSKLLVIRGGAILAKELTEAKLEKNPYKQNAMLRRALQDARALRSKAYSIPDDGLADYAWNTLTTPWYRSLLKYGTSFAKDGKVNNTSRESALSKFDLMIKVLEHEIDSSKV